MAIKINFEGIIRSKGFIFDGYAEYANNVFDAFKGVVTEMELPLTVTVEKFKSGGILSATVTEMILVTHPKLSPTYSICVGVSPFGQYLGVDLYLLADAGMFKKVAVAATGIAFDREVSIASKHLVGAKDIFEAQDILIYWASVESCLQETFSRLKFSEVKSGFLGIK